MSILRKLRLVLVLFAFSAAPALAQDWGVGASIGLVNDVEHRIRLEGFDPRENSAWIDFRLEDRVLLRGTLGSMRTKGSNAGSAAVIDGSVVTLPDLKVRINYVDVAVSYQFWEGDFTSGFFGGIGGYRVDPDAAEPELAEFRDPKETVFGFHAGVDGDVRLISRLSLVARITFHKLFSDVNRSLLTANVGAAFRF
ncbi:MAG TPA: outer membrane beta-barrel protein [Thermoanaerobaculia bacterium]|nr:outer membrane beta-barrel protein [Thermoanaerobaculia bacterium]